MSGPVRIQLSRAKGWRMPPDTVKVDRTTRWGNPFRIGDAYVRPRMAAGGGERSNVVADAAHAVRLFRRFTAREAAFQAEVRLHLRGKNLACWCAPGSPCHADVLLELANGERGAP